MITPRAAPPVALVDAEMQAKQTRQRKIKPIYGRLNGAIRYVLRTLPYFEVDGRIDQGIDQVTATITVNIPTDPVFAMWQREHDERIRRVWMPGTPKE